MAGDEPELIDELAEDYVRRLRAGESVTPEAYAAGHPDLAERIADLFPVLAMMEGLKGPPGAVTSSSRRDDVPRSIGPYPVRRELGRGGMGRVYEVTDAAGERRALKVVHPHLLERSGFLARFLREIEAGQRVEHEGIVRTLASGVAEVDGDELPYVLLEYVEGETLRDLLDETGGVSERLVREIGAAVAEALAVIHDAGIVHRDVKPENVILTPDERVKLADLGIALVREETQRITQTGEFVGSLLYAAPEQVRGGRVDARADLYALGLVLYELVAGQHAEVNEAGSVLAWKVATRRPRPLRQVVPHATPFLEAVLATLLEPDVSRRPSSAADVARWLRVGEDDPWWRERRPPTEGRRVRAVDAPVAFAGREAERAILDAVWADVRAGTGRVLLLRGEAGMGKSRLLEAWLDTIEGPSPGAAVLATGHAPGVGAVGPVPSIVGHVHELAREQPVVLVVEDLHFASDEGRDLFRRQAHAFADDAVLLVGTLRPGAGDALLEALRPLPHVTVLDVPPLGDEAAAQLLAHAMGPTTPPADAARALLRLSDGNPYYILEFARSLRERACTGAVGDPDLDVPRSVRELVEARLATLDEADRDLLAVAACCGYRFDPVVVCEASGLPRLTGLRALHRLERSRGLLVVEGAGYRFHHHLVQEVLQGEIPPALRAGYHGALAAATERHLPPDTAPSGALAYALARHHLLGDTPERAAPYVLAGLEYLMELAEGRRAARMARGALDALPEAPASLRAHLRFQLGRALDGHAPPTEIVQQLEQARREAREVGDRILELDVLQHLGAAISHTGRHAEGAQISTEAAELAEAAGDPLRLARALTSHATSHYNLGRHEEAFATGQRALDIAREAGAAAQVGHTAMILAAIYVESGRYADARPLAELALSITHLHGDRPAEQYVTAVLAKLANLQGDIATAERLLLRSRDLARELGNLRLALGSDLGIVQAALNLGRVAEAREQTEHALGVALRSGYPEIAALLTVPHALTTSILGDVAAAWETAARGRELIGRVPLPAIVARVVPALANVFAWTGAFEEAEALLEQGHDAAARAGVPRERAYLAQAAAGLLDARGDAEGALTGYAAVLDETRRRGLDLQRALLAVRVGGLLVRCGRPEEARAHLEEALTLAERAPLPAVVAEAGLWLDLLLGGNLQRAGIAWERDAALLPALARLRLGIELARRSDDERLPAAVRQLAEAHVARAPKALRERLATRVALLRDALS
ncbi:MAG: serine/threonine-protein kinase PknK [Planctomycetota bacterium]